MSPQRRGTTVQLRLAFTEPTRPVTLHLALSGVHILVEASGAAQDDSYTYLSAAGLLPDITDAGDLRLLSKRVAQLGALPVRVKILADEHLSPLVDYARHPSDDDIPATLGTQGRGLTLEWVAAGTEMERPLTLAAGQVLLTSELPFVATPAAWQLLGTAPPPTAITVGVARRNLDGFVEISTSKPQLVEAAPIPGLFRLGDMHFGMAMPFVKALLAEPAFTWEGPAHIPDAAAEPLEVPIALTTHARADVDLLVEDLSRWRASAVVWDTGLGRRVFVLAALAVLDAWPALIVCPPHAVWSWQRHLDLLGRSHSLSHENADAFLCTYYDLAARSSLPSPQSLVLDDVTGSEASSPPVRSALRRLDGVTDLYRVGIARSWPADINAAVEVMSLLRPVEFRADIEVARRYPVPAERRAEEHVAAYVSRRSSADPGSQSIPFRRSTVRVVEANAAQRRALEDLEVVRANAPAEQRLVEALEIVSAGPSTAISPKVAAASALARTSAVCGLAVVVASRHRRTLTLIKATLRPLEVATATETGPPPIPKAGAVTLMFFDRLLPDLRGFDEVVVVDYPFSTAILDEAVGAADEQGPAQVTVLHSPGTIDDRLAMLAARRRELGTVISPTAALSEADVRYLLTRRQPPAPVGQPVTTT